jgi:hypothetical protein
MPRNVGTSRVRRLHVVETIPNRHADTHETTPARDSEIPQPDSDGKFRVNAEYGDADPMDIDATLSGMSVLLRCALRLMRSYDASPTRRDRGR